MKKLTKVFFTCVMTLMLVLGLCPNAVYAEAEKGESHATTFKVVSTGAETATVTVQGMQKNDVIKAYKVVDVTYNPTTNTVDQSYNKAFEADAKTVYPTVKKYADAGDAGAEKLYKKIIENYSTYTNSFTATATADESGVASMTLPMGQYILVGVGANVYTPMTATIEPVVNPNNKAQYILYDVIVEAKATKPTIEKKIKDNNGKWEDSTSTAVNQKRDFKITVQAPIYPENAQQKYFRVNDSMEEGLKGAEELKIVNGSTSDNVLKEGTDYTVAYKNDSNETVSASEATKFTIEFIMSSDKVLGKTLTITYKSLATAKLRPGTAKNNNVTLEWPKNLWNEADGYNEIPDEVKVYTYGLSVQKMDESKNKLAGAEFKLYSDSSCKNVITFQSEGEGQYVKGEAADNNLACDENGYLELSGLDVGTYYLKEQRAPTGYILPTAPVVVEVKSTGSNNGYYSYEVTNTKGFNLPKTGDTMTMIFTMFGIFVMSGALASALYLRRKH